jgi:hypothetical protein
MSNPQIENLEKVVVILECLPDQFVFTGGATIALYVDEILWDDLRPTKDVDCVVEIYSRIEYYDLAKRLRGIGLQECTEQDAPLCRWVYQDLLVDVMPCDKSVLGFSNRWYVEGIAHKIFYRLPSGRNIWIFPPIYLLASKVEAFLSRGMDLRLSKDIEDIVILLDGCEELAEQFNQAQKDVKIFLASWFRENGNALEEAVLSFLPSVSRGREDFVFDLIQSFFR